MPENTDLFRYKWILRYPDGSFVGLDEDSGGYPYKARFPTQVQFWGSQDDAERYRSHFPRDNFSLHEVMSLTISLPVRTGE